MKFENRTNPPELKVWVPDDWGFENMTASCDSRQAARDEVQAQLPEIPEDVIKIFRPVDCWNLNLLPVQRGWSLTLAEGGWARSNLIHVLPGSDDEIQNLRKLQSLWGNDSGCPHFELLPQGPSRQRLTLQFEDILGKFFPMPNILHSPDVFINPAWLEFVPDDFARSHRVVPVGIKGAAILFVSDVNVTSSDLAEIRELSGKSFIQAKEDKYRGIMSNIEELLDFFYRERVFIP